MNRIFVSWIGFNDLKAKDDKQQGAILTCLLEADVAYDSVVLLTTEKSSQVSNYMSWLRSSLSSQKRYNDTSIETVERAVKTPIDYYSIYEQAREVLEYLSQQTRLITIGLSSGTPAMSTVWMLLAKGVFGCKCIQASRENGVEEISLPVDLSLHYLQTQDSHLSKLMSDNTVASFSGITSHSSEMNSLIQLAARVAIRDVPVVIQGPTGTGKEVLANAIHQASSRSQEKLVIVNCGSIPESLIESALFGHKKGAFTGAVSDKKGFFAEADGGTLFLDEVGELSLSAQVQLLRAIQQGEIQRVGDDTSTKVNVRIIAATHKNLLAMVDDGLFREDLFYRLAVGVLQVPRLSERKEDILPLSEALLKEINQDASTQPGFSPKTLSEGAKQLIYTYDWPGNVRELRTTLLRASIWSEIDLIEDQHIRQAIIWRDSNTTSDDVSYIAEGFDLNNHLAEVKKKHIEQALVQTKFRKKEAAELLGLGNHQTLSNWAKKVGLEI
ncbi:sigma 54-interacting transcriptional regulator [Vibrio sp. 10N.286.51.B11]|uniref:sigma-54-dependent transcriptional regulator n=1 Tax=unclassified Vibrio TaxID=2614977 RepID=UPI000D3B0174|nr:sigma-54 dependent transcriptional regulator [Vibrio sp. 10N.286.48.B8]PTO95331.1 AAA family ATPase [Vibrio sp. 10N.286.48.B8]